MNRDPNAVKRARLSAHTFAEIFNSFVEPISLKTMGVMFTALIIVLVVTNGTFTFYRRQYENHHPPHPYHPNQYQHPGGSYQYPPIQYPPNTPGMGHAQQNHLAWEQNQTQQAGNDGGHARLEYNRSPSKEYDRARSRSPEKKAIKS
jgi:Di-sulfide bridge nucleocytoplasmic transport domain